MDVSFPKLQRLQTGVALRFSGALATQACRAHWLTAAQVADVLEKDTDPYVGAVPEAILREMGLTEKQACQLLEGLSSALVKDFYPTFSVGLKDLLGISRTIRVPVEGKSKPVRVKVQYRGGGITGYVYRVTLGSEKYAFKVFHDGDGYDSREETAAGTFLSQLPVQDLSRMHFANPTKHWFLMEYVDFWTPFRHRPGQTLAELGIFIGDDVAHNRIHGIRIDHGGLHAPARFRKNEH